jgi:hypothetical protein
LVTGSGRSMLRCFGIVAIANGYSKAATLRVQLSYCDLSHVVSPVNAP